MWSQNNKMFILHPYAYVLWVVQTYNKQEG
jgi:hypothetical protein